eukprot:Phypoly_transcript_06097.p1 GENE.Phypoly_transcript_06097~~Phypoly_transcript_06097.p1  ORF type:complete len:502 (+),score=75.42 Phypoly_transcript_06097:124-1629(+)
METPSNNKEVCCATCGTSIPDSDVVRNVHCEHRFCYDCSAGLRTCPHCKKPFVDDALSELERNTLANTVANRALPPLEDATPTLPQTVPAPTHHDPPPVQELQHFSYTCPGLHGAGSHTRVQRMSFEQLFSSPMRVIIPLFQRSYCWNTSTTVPAWWRDTSHASTHSCGKAVFRTHDDAMWCLDGQQRVTTTMLLAASARDALLRLQHRSPTLPHLGTALAKLDAVLFIDVSAAHAFAAARTPIAEGQRLDFSRLIPSFCDRRHFFELIITGLAANGTDELLSETTRHSIQYDTKHYFDDQFQHMLDSNTKPALALDAVASRAMTALKMQLMMIEPLANINVAQVYQYLQESSLLSMGSLLHNPSPGMKMHAADLTRNLYMSPWISESLDEQERQHAGLWLTPIEVPCGNSPTQIDRVLRVLVDREIPDKQPSEVEKRLLTVAQMPGFAHKELSGLKLYARVLTLWEHFEDEARASIPDPVQRQRSVATKTMQMMATICQE